MILKIHPFELDTIYEFLFDVYWLDFDEGKIERGSEISLNKWVDFLREDHLGYWPGFAGEADVWLAPYLKGSISREKQEKNYRDRLKKSLKDDLRNMGFTIVSDYLESEGNRQELSNEQFEELRELKGRIIDRAIGHLGEQEKDKPQPVKSSYGSRCRVAGKFVNISECGFNKGRLDLTNIFKGFAGTSLDIMKDYEKGSGVGMPDLGLTSAQSPNIGTKGSVRPSKYDPKHLTIGYIHNHPDRRVVAFSRADLEYALWEQMRHPLEWPQIAMVISHSRYGVDYSNKPQHKIFGTGTALYQGGEAPMVELDWIENNILSQPNWIKWKAGEYPGLTKAGKPKKITDAEKKKNRGAGISLAYTKGFEGAEHSYYQYMEANAQALQKRGWIFQFMENDASVMSLREIPQIVVDYPVDLAKAKLPSAS